MKKLAPVLNNEQGFILPFLLVAIVTLCMISAYTISQVQTVTAGLDIQKALEIACKSAASQVVTDSQANGHPRINPDTAHVMFKRQLALNMGLDINTWNVLAGSQLSKTPSYVFVVYNGDSTYTNSATWYSFDGINLTVSVQALNGLPRTFAIDSNNITESDTGGTYLVTLQTPGVVAVINGQLVNISGNDNTSMTRWASSVLVCTNGGC